MIDTKKHVACAHAPHENPYHYTVIVTKLYHLDIHRVRFRLFFS